MKRSLQIAPSILTADFLRLGEQLQELEASGISVLHLDVMDGHFVPNLTFGPLFIRSLRRGFKGLMEAHLMVENGAETCLEYIQAGCQRIIVHVECTNHLHRVLQTIRQAGAQAGVSLNPSTPLSCLEHILLDLDLVLLMTVNPGFGGQAYIPAMDQKIAKFAAMRGDSPVLLEVDGGINLKNIARMQDLGVDLAVAGSAIFNQENSISHHVQAMKDALCRI